MSGGFSGFEIIFSRHALRRLRERGVGPDTVLSAISNPCQLVYDRLRDTYIAVAGDGSAVVYRLVGSRIVVLTVLGKREYRVLMSRYGRSRYKVIV